MKRKITIIMAATFLFSSYPTVVYAEETDVSSVIELQLETEEITENAGKEQASDIGEIISFEPLEKTEYSFDYQVALASLVSKLPDTLTVNTADGSKEIKVKWKSEADYNEMLDEYPFVPDMEGYTLAEGADLPRITVTFTNEHTEVTTGHRSVTDIGYEIPFVTDYESLRKAAKLPSYLNRFEEKALPPVRDQGRTGTCWVHGTIGAMEADMIHDKKETTDVDLSEWHLAYYFYNPYNDPKGCRKDTVSYPAGTDYLQYGASENYAVRVLFNQVGAIPDHYAHINPGKEPTDPNKFKPDQSYVISKDTAQLRNAYYVNPEDINSIKTAVYEHGGAAFGFHAVSESEEIKRYLNNTYAAYYCPDEKTPNHTVMIVGWDDDFSKDKFATAPEGNGAWLVRNSWGLQDYGYAGYFWLSYYDKSFCTDGCPVVAVDADTDLYQNCYSSAGFPFFVSEGAIAPESSIEVRYKVSAHEKVEAVGVEVTSASSNVKAVVKNLSTGQTETGKIKTNTAGLYTIVLSNPVEVYDKASKIEVSISGFSANGKPLSIGFEEPGEMNAYEKFDYTVVVDRGYYSEGKKYNDFDARIMLYTNASDAKYTRVKGVTLNKKKATLKDGKTLKLKATVRPDNATYKYVKWSSSDEKVATVSEEGIVQAQSPGKATITCKTYDQGKKARCTVTVEKVPLEDVSLKSKVSVYKGKTITLVPVFEPENASNKKVTWSSDNKKVATVDKNGKVTGKKPGKAKITVKTKEGGKTATCEVTVKKPIRVEKITLDKKSKTLNVGGKFKLKATIKPKNATEKGVKWSSSDKSVATVDKDGNVKAVKAGKATITAISKDNSRKKATCKVTVR